MKTLLFTALALASSLSAETVKLSATGKTFHKVATCMALARTNQVLAAERKTAERHNLKPCGICYRVMKAPKTKPDNTAWAKETKQ